jgi:hypothetical protein
MDDVSSRLEELKREGWTRQFVTNEPRLSEAVKLYEETGYEVHLEPVPAKGNLGDFPMMGTQCTTCFEGAEDQYKIIFTRPRQDGSALDDDLFD